ncbi:MAG: glycosyltransferase [Gammaproteobacteria bacterium]
MNQIEILLATYNGAALLGEQLDSIKAQTHRSWRLIARDDGSTDDTLKILEAFRLGHPDKVVVLDHGHGYLGLV